MESTMNETTLEAVSMVLRSVTAKGVLLWTEAGQLRYRAPKGALSAAEIDRLRAFKGTLVRLLESSAKQDAPFPKLGDRPTRASAPLSFSQLAHWQLYGLGERPAIRQIAAALRLTGELDLACLNAAIADVIHRHEALRTQVIVRDGVPVQEIRPAAHHDLELLDLTRTPREQRERAIRSNIDRLIMEPIRVSTDPLLATRLLKLDAEEHVLLVVMEHLIADAASLGIFLRELFDNYDALVKTGAAAQVPAPTQFGDYAYWQRSNYPRWLDNGGAMFRDRLLTHERQRFPASNSDISRTGWGAIPVAIGRELKTELARWCKTNHLTLPAALFGVYSGLVLRWCNASATVIRYQSDGRWQPEVQHTIGYLATVLYVPVELKSDDTWLSLIRRATVEQFSAYQHADFSDLAAQVPLPGIAKNTSFNWVPCQASDGEVHAAGNLTYTPIDFEHPMIERLDIDAEPSLLLYERREEITGYLYFPQDRHAVTVMEQFVRDYLACIERLLVDAHSSVSRSMV